jgi:uncharacterized protein
VAVLVVILIAAVAFTLSAAAGMGGSLLLVPAMALAFGPKAGIALAAVLLSYNNAWKLAAFRHNVPVRSALPLLVLSVLGSAAGARLMLAAPEQLVYLAIFVVVIASFALEHTGRPIIQPALGALFAAGAGVLSGFAGTSGPLKGLALRTLQVDRTRFVGAASLISLGGDVAKVLVLVPLLALRGDALLAALCAVPLAPCAVFLGRTINRRMGERAFSSLFWLMMASFLVRLALR